MPSIDPSVRYVWCPEYTLRSVPQRLFIAWENEAHAIGTDYIAPNIDEAELVCTDLNKPLGHDSHKQWLRIATSYIQITAKGAPVLLKQPEFKPWDRDAALQALDEFLPAYRETLRSLGPDTETETEHPDPSADMLGELARTLDRFVAETDDNIGVQRRHLDALQADPGAWEPDSNFRIFRAGELLRHFESVREPLVELRAKACDTYEIVTGHTLQLPPDMPPPDPGAQAAIAEAASSVIRV